MKKVLLVDDDQVIHGLINSTLNKYSSIFELVHAFDIKTAEAALERDATHVFSCGLRSRARR